MLKSVEILPTPAVEVGSYLILPDSQDSSTPDVPGFLLVAARIVNMKGQEDFHALLVLAGVGLIFDFC